MMGLLVMAAALAAPPHVSDGPPRTPFEERASFTVPAKFEVQLVAAEPDITKPVNLAFDARGRLWETCTVDYPFPAVNGVGADAVKILSDFGPDGRARSVRTFADNLTIPIGIQPYRDGAIVYSVAQLAHLRDTDGYAPTRQRPYAHALLDGLREGGRSADPATAA
jgi:hypothetical protein